MDLRLVDGALLLTLIPTRGYPRPDSPLRPPLPPTPVLQLGPNTLQIMDGSYKGMPVEILRLQDGSVRALRISRIFVRCA
jgi:hypothetical protein